MNCDLCRDGYQKITPPGHEPVHEVLGITWQCTDGKNVEERWFNTERQIPVEGIVVNCMNLDGTVVQLYRRGRMWLVPDGSSYMYYIPVLWKPIRLTSAKSDSGD